MREEILAEIRRLASEGGRAPGRRVFEVTTGIRSAEWPGVYWARWGDAIREAGLIPNELQGKSDRDFLLEKMAGACRHYGRLPTTAETRLFRKIDVDFPSHGTFNSHFKGQASLAQALREWSLDRPEYADVAMMMPMPTKAPALARLGKVDEGHVYLIRSGQFYKIGRSDQLERRVKEIRVALPDAATLVHSIRTDDPPGIEAYWHRRFADRRANGEWFRLTASDLAAFRRRKYQ